MRWRPGLTNFEVAVVSALWGPFLLLAVSAGAGMVNRMEALAAAREAAHAYARGDSLSDPNIQAALGRTGGGALIFSTVGYAGARECREQRLLDERGRPDGRCANYGHFVFLHRAVLGDARRCRSRFGEPDLPVPDPRTGAITPRDAVSDPRARADRFGLLRPPPNGAFAQPAYVVEACVPARDPGAFGMIRRSYAQAVF
jgi:hypothetical protein